MQSVAVLAFDGISQFHLAVPQLVFGLEGISGAERRYTLTTCAERRGTVTTAGGLALSVPRGLDAMASADVVVIPSWTPPDLPSERLLDAVRAAHARSATIVGLCLGSWVVAASGIADDRTVATHWAAAVELADAFPLVSVRSDELWCDHGDVVTSAGVAAALDCCLHIVRRHHGSDYAASLARAFVLAPHRVGTQAQYIPAPVATRGEGDRVDAAIDWALAHLDQPVSLHQWARAIAVSRRTLSRRFVERTGVSPMEWLTEQRVDHARRLLESTDLPVSEVARQAGFGSPESLRHHFRRVLSVSPTAHREAFAPA
jgi:transcriptional regulator GlxA family with amidase domain